ncbi:BQ5605_C013g07344 [Microbotryum silenes-dioicae]|uniref:BQ5605_C013g07344 protein n=1 Tax=Microbotryum silenes-dioicae TaxID=796604 RepID=A0A2X0MCW6_9BASI|nr:BQ5605_C013g07344 [Microbotryum silenes-dioicae]
MASTRPAMQVCLPVISEKGMIMHYGVNHEDWVWKVRSEAGVVGAFEKVYNTQDLIVSFDVIKIQFPHRKDAPANKPWAHQDQDPEQPGFRCLQGLVNLNPCGDDDGGLVVMPGAHLISEEYHTTFRDEERLWQWTNEWYGYKVSERLETGLAWLKERGYEFKKLNLNPGDLVIWDSRVPHYNVSPKGDHVRMAIYTCYAPVSTATREDLLRKKEAFEVKTTPLAGVGSSHWPQCLQSFNRPAVRNDGTPCPANRTAPFHEPVFNERNYKLTGIPYIATAA